MIHWLPSFAGIIDSVNSYQFFYQYLLTSKWHIRIVQRRIHLTGNTMSLIYRDRDGRRVEAIPDRAY